MIYRQTIEKDLRVLAQLRWDFQTEFNETTPEISYEAFVESCAKFLSDGLTKGE